jgi:hypothetical protein
MTTSSRGFTLIEAVIYLALFSILIGGAVVAAWSLFDAATRAGTRTMLSEETDFLLSKIDWTLASAEEVTLPGRNSSGTTLNVAKWDSATPAIMSWSGGDKDLFLDGERLNNTNVSVESALFRHVADQGAGTSPEYVEVVITTAARAPIGDVLYKTGTTTVYLRR